MSADAAVYLDTSALVKLIVEEDESRALLRHLGSRPHRASCALARVELVGAVRPSGEPALRRAAQLLERLTLIRLDDELLADAAALTSQTVRSLDAIHLAAARSLGESLSEIVTYDRRMTDAAGALGIRVAAPA